MKAAQLILAVTAVANASLGGKHTHQNQPGLNRIIVDYVSCATHLADLGEIAILAGKTYHSPPQLPLPETRETQVQGKRLLLGFLPGVTLGRMAVVDVVPQQLILRWIDSFHKSTQNEAHFGGLYVLYPIGSDDQERVRLFQRWDVPVVEIAAQAGLSDGRYGLVPVSQIATLEAFLRDPP